MILHHIEWYGPLLYCFGKALYRITFRTDFSFATRIDLLFVRDEDIREKTHNRTRHNAPNLTSFMLPFEHWV